MRLPLFLPCLTACLLHAQAGHWEGVIKQERRSAPFTVDLDSNPDWNGTFLIPGQSAPPLPLSGIELALPAIRFEVNEIPGDPTFKGMLGEEGASIKGTVTQGGEVLPFEMRRTGESQLQPIPRNTPLSPSLLGTWTGALQSAEPITLILHLRDEDAGKSSSGTLDTKDRRARNLLLSGIAQRENRLTFDVRLIGGHFEGELDPAETKISGAWTQNGRTLPLVFERER